MNQPKISVIVPVYKVEQYLRKCLDSIVNQTYQNLEIILVDDGSPDNCGAVCDEYTAKDDRIIVIHQENAGVSAARNAALDIATGDYIGFVDSDDWIEPDMYEYLLSLIQTHRADVVQCAVYMEENGQCTPVFSFADEIGAISMFESFEQSCFYYSEASWNKLYRTCAIEGLRFPTEHSWGEDRLYNVELLLRTRNIWIGPLAKYHYIQRQESACHQEVTLDFFKRCRKALVRAAELLENVVELRPFYLKICVQNMLDFCSKIARSERADFAEFREELRSYLRKNLVDIIRAKSISPKDRIKCVLIVYAWWLYRPLLLLSKSVGGHKISEVLKTEEDSA